MFRPLRIDRKFKAEDNDESMTSIMYPYCLVMKSILVFYSNFALSKGVALVELMGDII